MEKTAEQIIEEQVALLIANPKKFDRVLLAMESGDREKITELGLDPLFVNTIVNKVYDQSVNYGAAFKAVEAAYEASFQAAGD